MEERARTEAQQRVIKWIEEGQHVVRAASQKIRGTQRKSPFERDSGQTPQAESALSPSGQTRPSPAPLTAGPPFPPSATP